ncbi:MAG: hypothetical protein R1F54_08120 [Candidatus Zeuxoniibacter abyssi]|nr:MAG: hypothetical protein R1F54_08120 [Candidatus Persebacteraceae bacterium AB1(2)]
MKKPYSDLDIAESVANIRGTPVRHKTADTATFTDGLNIKLNPAKMTAAEKMALIKI